MRSFFKGLCFLFAFLPTLLNAQILKITDLETDEPIEGVSLMSNAPKAFAVSNLYGEVDVSNFKGSKSILISSLAYENINISYDSLASLKFELQLRSVSLQLEEVVVSASRWRQSSNHVPNKINTIKPKDVRLQNPQSAADLLGLSGKVFIQKSQQGGGSPMIRGFATNRLIYTIDGVRMNTAIFRGGNIQNVINLDPFSTEKTEVLFGPGSVVYGSDAIGGVMSFHTYGPQFSVDSGMAVSGNVFGRYATANQEKTGHLDFNIGLKKWAFYTSISHWNYDDLRQGSDGPDDYVKDVYVERRNGVDEIVQQDDELLQIPSAYSQLNLLQKVRFKASEHSRFDYAFHYSETSPYGRYDRHNRFRNGLPRYAEWNYGPQKWMMNLLSFKNDKATAFYDEVQIRMAHQLFNESRISRDLNDPERSIREEEVEALSFNLDLQKSLGARHQLFYGAEVVNNDVRSDGRLKNIENGIVMDDADRYPQSQWMSAAVFATDEFALNEKTDIQAGLRYNYFMIDADFSDNLPYYPLPYDKVEINNAALSGSLGAVYRPNEKWVIKTNLGTAFRAPNVDDIGKVFDSEPGAVVVPNPELDAEMAYNIDLGFAKLIKDIIKFDLTGYYTILENAMVRRDYTLNGVDSILYDGSQSKVQAIQNAAEARVYGLQVGLEVKFSRQFSWINDVNFQWGEEEMNDGSVSPSRHAAPFFGVSRLNFERKQSRLQFYVEYQGEVAHDDLSIEEQPKTEIYALDDKGNTFAPAWYTLNFKFEQAVHEQLSISGGVENITDQRYRPYSSGISRAGRNFFLALRASF
ncbi:MAG: TonB-dependent receptor [Flavobacteriales bacterium]|nr:TonB-dependent receptor [Flavobacteriales bacterium]